jgi:hypothetical protein
MRRDIGNGERKRNRDGERERRKRIVGEIYK